LSCERQSGRVATSAAVKAGIGTMANVTQVGRAGQSAGKGMIAAATQKAGAALEQWAGTQDALNEKVVGRMAPLSNAVLGKLDRPTVTAAKAAPYIIGALATLHFRGYLVTQRGSAPVAAVAVAPRPLGEIWRTRPMACRVRRAVGMAGAVSALSASAAVWATKEKAGGRTLSLKKNGQVMAEIKFQKSAKVTRFLNRMDLIGSHRLGKNVISSDGDIVRASKGGNWHRGTSTVQTSKGQRTLTHLQSLKLPAHHYYFDRKLSDVEVAGLVSGREKANQMTGYVGEVHPMENLVPTWGATKKGLITTRLYHPPTKARWSSQPAEKQR